MKQLKLLSTCGLVCSIVFASFSLVFYFGDWFRLITVASLGLFIGFLAAPEFEPKLFKKAWLVQLSSGAVAGAIVGLVFQLTSSDTISSAIIGGFIGVTTRFWVKHMPIP
jgi:hypothetical protein